MFVFNVVTSTYSPLSLNAQNVINWKRNFKEHIIKKYLEERITKEVVIIRIRFSCKLDVIFPTFHTLVKGRKNNFQFLTEEKIYIFFEIPKFSYENSIECNAD